FVRRAYRSQWFGAIRPLVWVRTGRKSEPISARVGARRGRLRREGGEELCGGSRGASQEIVAVEHLVRGDRGDLDGRRSEVEDRDPILATRTAAEPNDETGRLGHDGRDVTTVVVLAAAAARDLLEMADELIDPTHASPTTHFSCLPRRWFVPV